MNLRPTVIAFSGLVVVSAAIMWSGAQLVEPEPTFQADRTDIEDAESVEIPDVEAPLPEPDFAQPDVLVEPSTGEIVTEPAIELEPLPPPAEQPPAEFERLPPREPLSDLAAPRDPAKVVPEKPGEAKTMRLFKPVATSAGTLEAQGYTIVLDGLEAVSADESCSFEGNEWPCGTRARTAFRSWLRGRAISCTVPSKPGPAPVVSTCFIGKIDLAEWLAINGWARASEAGPYAQAGREAREAGKGIFGAAPAQGVLNLPSLPDPEPIIVPGVEPPVSGFEEPVPQAEPDLTGPFPPAPQ